MKVYDVKKAAEFAQVEMDAAAVAWGPTLGGSVRFTQPAVETATPPELAVAIPGRQVFIEIDMYGDGGGSTFLIMPEEHGLLMVSALEMLSEEEAAERMTGGFSGDDLDALSEMANHFVGAAASMVDRRLRRRFDYVLTRVEILTPVEETEQLMELVGDSELVVVEFECEIQGVGMFHVLRVYSGELADSFLASDGNAPSGQHAGEKDFRDSTDVIPPGTTPTGGLSAIDSIGGELPEEVGQGDIDALMGIVGGNAAPAETSETRVIPPEREEKTAVQHRSERRESNDKTRRLSAPPRPQPEPETNAPTTRQTTTDSSAQPEEKSVTATPKKEKPKAAAKKNSARTSNRVIGLKLEIYVRPDDTELPIGEVLQRLPGSTINFPEDSAEQVELERDGETFARGDAIIVNEYVAFKSRRFMPPSQ